jgi:hypothetical protein
MNSVVVDFIKANIPFVVFTLLDVLGILGVSATLIVLGFRHRREAKKASAK